MLYLYIALICLVIVIFVAIILALKNKISKSVENHSVSFVTSNLDNSDIELSKALECLEVCNSVMEGLE